MLRSVVNVGRVAAAGFMAAVFCGWGCSSDKVVRDTQRSVSRSGSGTLMVTMKSESYVIKQGDNIDLAVWGYPEFNTSTTVKSSGAILIPLIGEVRASGFTKDDFTDHVRQRLAEYVQGDARISVSVASQAAQKVTVLGAVTRQDNYPVTSEVSLVEIITTAGGTTPESDLNHVRIIRFGNNIDPIHVDLEFYMETGEVDLLPRVRPGDTVFVPKKENFIRSFSDFLRDVVLVFGFFRVLN